METVLIKHYRLDKNYGRRGLLKEFPNRGWTEGGLDSLLKKIDRTNSTTRKEGSGRPRTDENIEMVENLIQSQEEDRPGTCR